MFFRGRFAITIAVAAVPVAVTAAVADDCC